MSNVCIIFTHYSDKPGSPAATELVDSGATGQDPNTISRAPHPTTGELYTQVDLSSKRKEAGQVVIALS